MRTRVTPEEVANIVKGVLSEKGIKMDSELVPVVEQAGNHYDEGYVFAGYEFEQKLEE